MTENSQPNQKLDKQIYFGEIPRDIGQIEDRVGGDEITVGDVSGSYAAIGAGAKVIVNQVQQALSAVDEMEKSIQAAERRLAEAIQRLLDRYTRLWAEGNIDGRSNPYKSLDDYKLEDAPFFYGRDDAIAAMWNKMGNGRLTVIESESGSGKSSLLQAGLASRLLVNREFPLYVRAYDQPPSQAIKRAFLRDYTTLDELTRFRDDNMDLPGFLERVTYYLGERQLIIFLDQFEEFFTEQPPEDQEEFARQLRQCVQSDLPVRWVLALRKEYLAELRLFDTLSPFNNKYFLPTFKIEEAQEVIVKPAALKGVGYEEGVVDAILADIGRESESILPVQVQLVCYTLFDELLEAGDTTVITHALYEKPRGRGDGQPGAPGILTSHLTRVVDSQLTGHERRLANRILEGLVTSDLRRAVKSEEKLLAELNPQDPVMFEHVLEVLSENRLLRRSLNEEDQPVYELTHDYLLSEITLDPDTQALKEAQELLAQSVKNWNRLGILIGPDTLTVIHKQRRLLHPDSDALKLLLISAAQQQQQPEYWADQMTPATRSALIGVVWPQFISFNRSDRGRSQATLWALRRYLPWTIVIPVYIQHFKWQLLLALAILIIAFVISFVFFPVNTGWQKIESSENLNRDSETNLSIVAVDAANADLIYASDQTTDGLYHSANGGMEWAPVGRGLMAEVFINSLGATNNTVYATSPEGIFVSTDQGNSWRVSEIPGRRADQVPGAVAVDPEDPLHAYVGVWHAGVFETGDGGVTWTALDTPGVYGDQFYALTTDGERFVVSTEQGVWLHHGSGEWVVFKGDPPLPATVYALSMPGRSGRFFMALGENGIGDADVSSFRWFEMSPPPPVDYVGSVASVDGSYYIVSNQGMWCWREWHTTDVNWWRYRLGLSAPCGP